MRVMFAQQNYRIGDFRYNTDKIIEAIQLARSEKADLVLFSELCVCGYFPDDFLEFENFIAECEQAVGEIMQHTTDVAVVIGAPSRNPAPSGKRLFNSAYFLHEKKVVAKTDKCLLPNYDVFDEYRYFEPGKGLTIVNWRNTKIAVTICEDIWNEGQRPLYISNPLEELSHQDADLIVNISASPFDYLQAAERNEVIKNTIEKYKLPLLYCNTTGCQGELIFDGGSMAFNKHGELMQCLPFFEEANRMVELDTRLNPIGKQVDDGLPAAANPQPASVTSLDASHNMALIHEALLHGIGDYFLKQNFTKAIVASSGGLDSAVTIALACEALGSQNVTAVLMPSPFSSSHSVDDAVALSTRLNNPYHLLKIGDIYESFLATLQPLFKDLPFSVAEENLQSRIRGALVMGVANKFGHILLNTSNKSELSVGYGTLYGDLAGGLAVLGDLYKLQVYELARYINRNGEIIPAHILTKAPSAELRPDQKDSDSLPDYSVLDQILFQYIEHQKDADQMKAMGFDAAVVDRVLKLVTANEFKRKQFCPILRVSPKAFGYGRKMPLVAKYLKLKV